MVSRTLVRAGALAGSALAVLFAVAGCSQTDGPAVTTMAPTDQQQDEVAQPPQDIGGPLYTAKGYHSTQVPASAHVDPIVIRQATVTLSERLEVSSQVDGELWAIATPLELKPGEPWPPQDKLWKHPRTGKFYRRLSEGDNVEAGQVVALIDDEKVWARFNGMRQIEPLTAEMVKLGKQLSDAGREMLSIDDSLLKQGGRPLSRREYLETQFGTLRGEMDYQDKSVSALNTTSQMKEMGVELEHHVIHTSISGIIKRIHKVPGSTIRGNGQSPDVIMDIENPNRLAIEGQVGVQYTQFLPRGMSVEIEPEQQVGHLKDLPAHQQPITAITVGRGPGGQPLIVTASEDRSICVQDRYGKLVARLRLPSAARALACTTSGPSLLAVAAADGKVRIWDLTNVNTNSTPREMKLVHRGPVTAVAFSPDGQYAASGDDQSIWLWDVASGERKYEFPTQQRGPITVLQFTPQCKLISVCRDNTLMVWNLGQTGAARDPNMSVEGRSGAVPFLGASADGQEILFDQNNKTLRLLTLPEKRLAATLEAPESNAFANFALFSPDSKLILVGSSATGRMQLWQVPGKDNRARAVRQFVCESAGKTPYDIVAAAFAPDGSFAVAGTQQGDALILPLPTQKELSQRLPAVLTLIDHDLADTSGKQSRVKAELANPSVRLSAGDHVTIVAMPETNGQ